MKIWRTSLPESRAAPARATTSASEASLVSVELAFELAAVPLVAAGGGVDGAVTRGGDFGAWAPASPPTQDQNINNPKPMTRLRREKPRLTIYSGLSSEVMGSGRCPARRAGRRPSRGRAAGRARARSLELLAADSRQPDFVNLRSWGLRICAHRAWRPVPFSARRPCPAAAARPASGNPDRRPCPENPAPCFDGCPSHTRSNGR